jgi:PIN domain nuclease of toxin-antitoxin system
LPGVLLDTHTLYWLVSGESELAEEALVAIGENQEAGSIFVSPITAWELSIAAQKRPDRRPNLGEMSPDAWFKEAVRAITARIVPIHHRIACEAATIAGDTGHKDPGDTFLMASARVRGLSLVTRDETILGIAAAKADYLDVIGC